jgi:hypothetical protein
MDTVIIRTISHKDQRYPTAGDWITKEEGGPEDEVSILVSAVDDPRMEFLIAVHELVEWFLCKEHAIRSENVTNFDAWFEEHKNEMAEHGLNEPGESLTAPYYHEHRFASVIERVIAHELNVDWREYERELDKLDNNI